MEELCLWRASKAYYISCLGIGEGNNDEILHSLKKYIYEKTPEKAGKIQYFAN